MPAKIPRTHLIHELRRLYRELGRTPILDDMREQGKYSSGPYFREFGSWRNAQRAAWVGTADATSIATPKGQLLADIRELSRKLGKIPAADDMDAHGPWSAETYYQRFGSWKAARVAAGFEKPNRVEAQRHELLTALEDFADTVDGSPTQRAMTARGPFSSQVYVNRFGSWNNALAELGLEPNNVHGTSREVDCTRCSETVERLPSQLEKTENTFCTYECHKVWLRETGALSGENSPRWKGGYDPYYGAKWPRQRARARTRDNHTCQDCGRDGAEYRKETGRTLDVHHKTPFRCFDTPGAANQLDNLVTLCRSCHAKR